MTELSVAPLDTQDAVESNEHVIEAVCQPTVVITEQEVVFSTAAAAPLRRTKHIRGVVAALRVVFLGSSEGAPPARRSYPPRRDPFLEDAALAREMHRL